MGEGAREANPMPFITDLWYTHRARAGDRKAFDALFHRHSPRVYNLLRRLGAAPDEAEDLSQDTFVTAFGSLPSWRASGALSTWLCGIAVNKYRAAHRRNGGRADFADVEDAYANAPAPPGDDPLARLTRDETGRQLQPPSPRYRSGSPAVRTGEWYRYRLRLRGPHRRRSRHSLPSSMVGRRLAVRTPVTSYTDHT